MNRLPKKVGRPPKTKKEKDQRIDAREFIRNMKVKDFDDDVKTVNDNDAVNKVKEIIEEIKKLKSQLKEIKVNERKKELAKKGMISLGRFCVKLEDIQRSRLIIYTESGISRSNTFNMHRCTPLFKSILLNIFVDKVWDQSKINELSDIERLLFDRLVEFSHQKFGDVVMDNYESALSSGLQELLDFYHKMRDKIAYKAIDVTHEDLDKFTQAIYALRYERFISIHEYKESMDLIREIRDSLKLLTV